MTEHYCEFRMVDGEPCGRPAHFKTADYWQCAFHYDAFMEAMKRMGFTEEQIQKHLEETE